MNQQNSDANDTNDMAMDQREHYQKEVVLALIEHVKDASFFFTVAQMQLLRDSIAHLKSQDEQRINP